MKRYFRMVWDTHPFNNLIYSHDQNKGYFFYSPKENRWRFSMGMEIDEIEHLKEITEQEALLEVDEKIQALYCPECGWNITKVAMKPECPECKTPLNVLYGTKEEIDQHIKKVVKSC